VPGDSGRTKRRKVPNSVRLSLLPDKRLRSLLSWIETFLLVTKASFLSNTTFTCFLTSLLAISFSFLLFISSL